MKRGQLTLLNAGILGRQTGRRRSGGGGGLLSGGQGQKSRESEGVELHYEMMDWKVNK